MFKLQDIEKSLKHENKILKQRIANLKAELQEYKEQVE